MTSNGLMFRVNHTVKVKGAFQICKYFYEFNQNLCQLYLTFIKIFVLLFNLLSFYFAIKLTKKSKYYLWKYLKTR